MTGSGSERPLRVRRVDGGQGIDTLTLKMTCADWFRPQVQADIAAYIRFLDGHTDPGTGAADTQRFHFIAFDLTAARFENLRVIVDGVALAPRRAGHRR